MGNQNVLMNLGWLVVFAFVGGMVGVLLVMGAAALLPWFINRMTPNVDEEKEIVRGNVAVAEYFGRMIAAAILGVSIVIAAAVLGAIIAALY